MVEDWPDSARLLRATQIAGLGHYVWDVIEDRCLFCSDEHAAIHGMSVSEYISQSSTQNGLSHPDDLEAVRCAYRRLKEGQPFELEFRIITPRGDTRFIREIGHPIFDKNGKVVRELGTSQDITNQKKREKQIAQAQRMEAVGLLTGGISHDFNNLMSIVSGSLQLIEQTSDENERKKLVKTALRAIEHGADLTRQMLALGRRSPLLPRPTDLKHAVVEFASFAARVLPESIEITVGHTSQCPIAIVDPSMLQNALLNLALNSKAAMPKGGSVVVKAEVQTAPEAMDNAKSLDGKCAVISFSDNGTGISELDLEKVYEPFFTTREVGEGSGLGLSMVKGFTEQSNGLVQIESELGKGTTVRLFFPLTLEEPVFDKRKNPAAVRREPKTRGSTVLVVEDNPQLLELLALQLERDGFNVIKKRSGDEALEVLKASAAIDIVVSDAVMPGVNQGIDVLRQAKSLSEPIPVILISGYADVREPMQTDLLQADRFLEKPLKLATLSLDIHDVLSLRQNV